MEEFTMLKRGRGVPKEADFCLRLDNDCMEPYLKQGQLVFIDRNAAPEEMQPGLFYYRGRILCRQWCEDSTGALHLLCANPGRERENLRLDRREKAACLCLGRVILKNHLPMPIYDA